MCIKLTDKQKMFCQEYIVDLNAYQAALRAGYTDTTAKTKAHKWLDKASYKAYLATLMAKREKRTEITQDKVLLELSNLAFANATDFAEVEQRLEQNGVVSVAVIKSTAELTSEQRAAIVGIKQGSNGVEVKLADKTKALELIGRHLGMFTDRLELSGEVNIADTLRAARARARDAGRG